MKVLTAYDFTSMVSVTELNLIGAESGDKLKHSFGVTARLPFSYIVFFSFQWPIVVNMNALWDLPQYLVYSAAGLLYFIDLFSLKSIRVR